MLALSCADSLNIHATPLWTERHRNFSVKLASLPARQSATRRSLCYSCHTDHFNTCAYCCKAQKTTGPSNEKVKLASLAAAALLFVSSGSSIASEVGDVFVGPPRIVDGDTLVIGGQKVRLFGLDAPESKQSCQNSQGKPYACGQVSTEALKKKIGSASLQCQVRATDLYGRNVSSCTLPGTGDIGDWLVKNGYAVAYRQYSKDYIADEEAAKSQQKGIWQGDFEVPADWRRNQKGKNGSSDSTPASSSKSTGVPGALANLPNVIKSGKQTSQPGCDIKGNISGKGDRIYHVPGGRYYDNVKIEPFKGEAFFCSEKEAEQAGFRKSRE